MFEIINVFSTDITHYKSLVLSAELLDYLFKTPSCFANYQDTECPLI